MTGIGVTALLAIVANLSLLGGAGGAAVAADDSAGPLTAPADGPRVAPAAARPGASDESPSPPQPVQLDAHPAIRPAPAAAATTGKTNGSR